MKKKGHQRLQKILAAAGYGSRRSCEELISQGRVAVNRKVAQLGQKADPEGDRITVDGEPVAVKQRHTYLALHKPRGVLSHKEGRSGHRTTVHDLVSLPERLFPAGRLDLHSEGLVLMTDDGELTYRLTHPRFEHAKEYRVQIGGHPGKEALQQWRRGVFLDGRRTAPAEVTILDVEGDDTWLRVVLHEGRKRQIRRVAAMLGHPVRRLIRVRIGPVRLGDLQPGEWRHLTTQELEKLEKDTSRPAARRKRKKSGRRSGK